MAVFPDELIKMFVFMVLVVSTFSFFMNGLSYVHDDIDEISGVKTIDEIEACDFSEEQLNQEIVSYPTTFERDGIYWRLFPKTFWTPKSDLVWEDSGNYGSVSIEADSEYVTGERNLYLDPDLDSVASGNYYIRWEIGEDLRGTTLNTIDSYVSLVNESEFVVDVRVVDVEDNVSFQKNFNISNADKINHVLDLEGYEIKDHDEIMEISITTIDERSTIEEPMAQFKEFTVYGEPIETYNLRDYNDCAIMVVLEFGRTLFLDTGVAVVDSIMAVFGAINFIISIIIALVLLVISLIIGALQFVIL